MKTVVLAVLLAMSASLCAAAKDKESIGPQTDFKNMSPEQALDVLQNANSIKVHFKDGWGYAKRCNGSGGDKGKTPETACWLASGEGQPSLLVQMQALFRGCGLYAISPEDSLDTLAGNPGETCGRLGELFFELGNTPAARAIWENAPGCHARDINGRKRDGCVHFIVGGAIAGVGSATNDDRNGLQAYASDPSKLFAMAKEACDRAQDPFSCLYLKKHGEQIDMEAVEEETEKKNDAVDATVDEARAEKSRESDARTDALMGALQSMPGANDPNAVLNAGNRQAAAMRRIGDARANQPPVAAANTTAPQTAEEPNSSGAATSEICPNMQGYPDAGASCNPVKSESTCVKVLSANWNRATATGAGMLRVTFQNICGSTVRITAWGPADGSNTGEVSNVAPGGQYIFASDQEQYQYQVDDGIDCAGNLMRPGCKTGQ